MTPLIWTRISRATQVTHFREFTYVMTRDGGKRGRVTLTVTHPQLNEVLAREVAKTFAMKEANNHARLLQKFGRRVEALICRVPTLAELSLAELPIFKEIERLGLSFKEVDADRISLEGLPYNLPQNHPLTALILAPEIYRDAEYECWTIQV